MPTIPPIRGSQQIIVKCSIRRDYGDVELEYGLEQVYLIPDVASIGLAFDELRAMVENQHELAIQNRPALSPQKLKDHVSQNELMILCTHVRKENVEGKVRIRLLGGEYTTHGIAVYNEYMSALEIDPEKLDYGDTPYNQYVIIQVDGRGNPKRALRIVQPTT